MAHLLVLEGEKGREDKPPSTKLLALYYSSFHFIFHSPNLTPIYPQISSF